MCDEVQNQSLEVLYDKNISKKFRNIQRKKAEKEFLFNKVAGLDVLIFVKKRLQLRSLPLDIGKFLRTLDLKSVYEQLILRVLKTYFMLPVSFDTPRKHQQMRAWDDFSGCTRKPMENTPLYKTKAIFVCVSVNRTLISNKKDLKDLKLSDYLLKIILKLS